MVFEQVRYGASRLDIGRRPWEVAPDEVACFAHEGKTNSPFDQSIRAARQLLEYLEGLPPWNLADAEARQVLAALEADRPGVVAAARQIFDDTFDERP